MNPATATAEARVRFDRGWERDETGRRWCSGRVEGPDTSVVWQAFADCLDEHQPVVFVWGDGTRLAGPTRELDQLVRERAMAHLPAR